MDRVGFHKLFKSPGPVVLPVVHVLDVAQAEKNLRIAIGEGAAGAFLINHDFPLEPFLPMVREIRALFPRLWLGVNFLAVTGREAFPILGELQEQGFPLEAYWADDACIDERRAPDQQADAAGIAAARTASGWQGLYFGGTAFKKQREVPAARFGMAARLATAWMDVVTTSGIATGEEADSEKISAFRQNIGDRALALASGVTSENAARYGVDVDCLLVATGINQEGDFYNIDPERLARLMAVARSLGGGASGGESHD